MALLEIIHLTGDVERRDLYKRQPLTIGSHSTNDLRIDEEGVEIMHCRVSWNKDNWEAVAAGASPFDLNGTPVQRANLKSGDTLRFGTVDVRFHGGVTADEPPADDFGIKPTSDEEMVAARNLPKKKGVESKGVAEPKKPAPPPPVKPQTVKSDEQLMQSLELLAYDDKKGGRSKKPADLDDDLFDVEDDEATPAPPKPVKAPPKRVVEAFVPAKAVEELDEIEEAPPESRVGELLKRTMQTPRRPGEIDTVRSPLVLGLVSFVVLALLVAGTFYFIAGRRIAETEFEAAKKQITDEKYKSGIEALEDFVKHHPKHEKVLEAQQLIGLTKVDQYIKSGAPNYAEGVKGIREFASAMGDQPNFEAMKAELATRSGNIALGAAQLAGKNPKAGRPLLATSREARTLLATYSPKGTQPTEKLREIDTTFRNSEGLLRKFEINDGITNEIKKALLDKQPMEALRLRRNLLAQYPDYAKEKAIQALLKQALDVERSLVVSESPNTAAKTEDEEALLSNVRSFMAHARTRADQVSVNEIVWVFSKDCLYGIDTITGMPVWRRVSGSDPTFFPVEEQSLPSLIYFDSDVNELVRIHRNRGTLVWRLALGSRASGKPLIVEGDLYLTTEDGSLLKINLNEGTITSRLTFSQPVTGPALIEETLADGKTSDSHLVVVGDQDVVYTLTKRPLECVAVSYIGQKSQSVRAPLISVGPFAGFIENQSEISATLHLLRREADKTSLLEAGNAKVSGMVVDDAAVIRGRDLFVPSAVERVSAFTVSNSPGEPALTVGPTFQVQGAKGSPIFLTTGPEHQVWVSSSALRRIQLTNGSFLVDPNVVAIGISSQPNQHKGTKLYNARRRPFTDAVTLTQTERETLTSSDWQVQPGAQMIAVSPFTGTPASLMVVNEGGATFKVTEAELSQPGFQFEPVARLTIKEETTQPLMACALPEGQAAVVCGAPEPRIWIINRLGLIERQGTLPGNPQAPPVSLGKRVVVPIEGKLHVAKTSQAEATIQDFQFPSGDATPVWKRVLAVDDKTLVGLTEAGELLQFRVEANPKPFLSQVANQSLPGSAVGTPVMFQGRFAVACSTGETFLFDASKFEARGRRTLETPATEAAYFTEVGVLVDTGGEELHCLNPDADLSPKWKLKLNGSSLAGQPAVIGGELVLAFQSGLVMRVNPENGELTSQQQAAGSLDSGPLSLGETAFLKTWDGSLIHLPASAAK